MTKVKLVCALAFVAKTQRPLAKTPFCFQKCKKNDYLCPQIYIIQKQVNSNLSAYNMYSLKYKVTTSTCDSEGKLKLYSALQMMQDCSEMWIDSEPEVKDYFLQQNMAQLLATRQVEIIRVPDYKEELTVTTSVNGMKPMFGFRNSEVSAIIEFNK